MFFKLSYDLLFKVCRLTYNLLGGIGAIDATGPLQIYFAPHSLTENKQSIARLQLIQTQIG